MTESGKLKLYPHLTISCVFAHQPTADIVCGALEAIEDILDDIEMVAHPEKMPDGTIVERRLADRRNWIEQACSSKTPDAIGGLPRNKLNVSVTTLYGTEKGVLHVNVSEYWSAKKLDQLIIEIGDRTGALNCGATDLNSSPILREGGKFRAANGRLVSHGEYHVNQYPHLETLIARIKSESESDVVRRIHPNHRIGWLNYWSADLAADIGLNAEKLKQGGFYKLEKTRLGWYLRLTEEPLDIRRPEHAEILLRAYELLPVGRSTG